MSNLLLRKINQSFSYYIIIGEVVTSLVNDMSISEAEVQEKFHKLAYSVFASSKAAVSQFDSNEQFQLGRIRMRDTELIIYQGMNNPFINR